MFETMESFLWFFIPAVILICVGIVFEDKLIAFEQKMKRTSIELFDTAVLWIRHSRQMLHKGEAFQEGAQN